ncbi:hypothetical protein HNR42_002923 [Deinobacterium chartae]|uniref:DUF554 domain-containing protein n=1 Tax=Deinobacterium chartae TaxID=521158 RepID=A0A841I2H4_9DEIO|nr:DUF554 domain-containing protein [Deinobacterium chartae]MBB6099473.1 hypothetical protein [Deinobacterium chartae]
MDLLERTSGTWINVLTVIAGTALGLLLGGRLPERMSRTLMQVLGLTTLYIGISMALSLEGLRSGPLPGVIVALVSLALGGVAGEALRLEERLAELGEQLRRRLRGSGRFTEGFVTASLLFCIGPMAIIGSLQNGLQLDPKTLILKATLDGIAAVALTGVYGMGVGFSAIIILLLQGSMSLAAGGLAGALPDPARDVRVLLVTGAGGLMIMGIGLNLLLSGLGLEDRRIRVGSMLPALLIAPLVHVLATL